MTLADIRRIIEANSPFPILSLRTDRIHPRRSGNVVAVIGKQVGHMQHQTAVALSELELRAARDPEQLVEARTKEAVAGLALYLAKQVAA